MKIERRLQRVEGDKRGREDQAKESMCENATIILAALPANLKDPEGRKRVHQ